MRALVVLGGLITSVAFVVMWALFYLACFVPGDAGYRYGSAGFVTLILVIVAGGATAALIALLGES